MIKLPPYSGFVALSILGHLVTLYPVISPGVIEFARPVSGSGIIMIDIAAPPPVPVPQHSAPRVPDIPIRAVPQQLADTPPMDDVDNPVYEEAHYDALPIEQGSLPAHAVKSPTVPPTLDQSPQQAVASTPTRPVPIINPPLRRIEEFFSSERETLTYQVRLRGVPVGSAQMEASSSGGEFRITLKMNSTQALSAVYPVQSQIETRHIGGNFVITKIRRQEGTLRSDHGFTISLRDKNVFWVDLLKRRSTTETIPTSEVLDPFSALYLLRNRPLQVGKTEMLHVYDGDAYSELPVEIVRADQMQVPGKGDVPTLVLKPLLRHDAVFSRTGEMLIWVTNDEFKVPVKVETSILLGKVTAELVSAESVPSPDVSLKSPSSAPQF